MGCPACGVENATTAKFCQGCGARLAHGCPHCGHEVGPAAKFCQECGVPLGGRPAGNVLGRAQPTAESPPSSPNSYTPRHLAEKIMANRAALEGERTKELSICAAFPVRGQRDTGSGVARPRRRDGPRRVLPACRAPAAVS